MITYRSRQEIEKLRKSSELVARTVQHLAPMVKPGVTTADLDQAAEAYIRKHGGIPAFKGYRDFPASLCTSINETRELIDADVLRRVAERLTLSVRVDLFGMGVSGMGGAAKEALIA